MSAGRVISLLLALATLSGGFAQPAGIPTPTPLDASVIEMRLREYARKNSAREPVLWTLFQEAGCKGVALTEQPVKGFKAPNLICTLTGTSDSTIVVGAHFDLVEAGSGVVDNWTGAALLPSLFQVLADSPRKHTYQFVGFTAEEQGLFGSKAFVEQLGTQRERVKAMVNMDSLGLSDTKVWTSHADGTLVDLLAATAKSMNLPVSGVNVEAVGTTDSEPFRTAGIPAITIHSVTQETFRFLHSPYDRIGTVHFDAYYRTYQLVLAYLGVLDEKLD